MRRGLTVFLLLLLSLTVGVGSTAAQENFGLTAADIARISQSVVYIEAYTEGSNDIGIGSGTIVDPSGIIYTNHHVIEGADQYLVYVTRDVGELPEPIGFASLVQDFRDVDFAILQIDRDPDGNPIPVGSLNLPALQDAARETTLGERIWVFGYPGVGDGYLVVTQGSITSVENANLFDQRVPAWYRTDAEISPGNSGGLVVNGLGQFLGIPTMVRSEERTLGRLGGVLPFIAVETVLTAFESGIVSATSAELVVENNANEPICYLYISPVTSTSWGNDQLGERVLEAGQSLRFPLEPGDYDISMRDCSNAELAQVRSQSITDTVTLTYPLGDTSPSIVAQSLSIEITDIEYDVAVDEGGETGVRVYTEIKAIGYRDQEIVAGVFFYNENGTPVSCENMSREYCSPEDGITVQAVLTPSFDDTVWEEYWFWIPYSGFPSGLNGTVDFTVQGNAGPNDNSTLNNPSILEEFSVDFGGGSGGPSTTGTQDFSIDITTMEFDTTGDYSSAQGIRTYTDFTVTGALGVPVRVALFFYYEDGSLVECDATFDEYYCGNNGELTVQEVVTPEFASSQWTGYWMHVPYQALPKGLSGTIPVRVRAFIDLDGGRGFNTRSDFYNFELYY